MAACLESDWLKKAEKAPKKIHAWKMELKISAPLCVALAQVTEVPMVCLALHSRQGHSEVLAYNMSIGDQYRS